MNEANSNKIIYYTAAILIVISAFSVFAYPWIKGMAGEKEITATIDTSVDKAFFEKIEALQDNTIEFDEENIPKRNPFKEVE